MGGGKTQRYIHYLKLKLRLKEKHKYKTKAN